VAGFPLSLIEFQRRSPDERACVEYAARWSDGSAPRSAWQGLGAGPGGVRRLRPADFGDCRAIATPSAAVPSNVEHTSTWRKVICSLVQPACS
jgi:hypothetical protein